MTSTTTPIDDAVAALKKLRHEIISKADSRYDAQIESLIDILIDAFTASFSVLRAQPEKMKAAEEPTDEMIAAGIEAIDKYYDGTKEAWYEGSVAACYKAMNALAAQPEPRPLRELIAEGHQWFWIEMGANKALHMAGKCSEEKLRFMESGGVAPTSRFLDCPAIPIIKPTVTLK